MRQQVVTQAEIAETHPCLAGHFPGRPIVPAVLVLDEVAAALRHALGPLRIASVTRAKFMRPILPAQTFRISLDIDHAMQRVRYQCHCDGELAADGELGYSAPR